MIFTDAELDYLRTQDLGRLATVAPDGTLQVNPVGFTVNTDLDTIDIGGFALSSSRKYRNLQTDPRCAFVVDDVTSRDPWRVRFVEIRGHAEAVPAADPVPADGADDAVIRVHATRIISLGLGDGETDRDPHLLTPNSRRVGADGEQV